jgi:hypothetical protein
MRLGYVALLALLAPLPAGATGMSINHVNMPQGTTVQACVARAAQAVAQVGLTPLNNLASSAWGESTATDGSSTLYAVYCLPSGTAVIIGAANRSEFVDSTVTALRDALINRAAAPAPGPAPAPQPSGPSLGGAKK